MRFKIYPLLVIFWAVASLAVLLPLLGIAWLAVRLTDLTLAQAYLLTFGTTLVLLYLMQTYMSFKGITLWLGMLLLSVASLVGAVLEGGVLRNLTDLTFFQATLAASSANLLVAYMVGHSLTGSIPPFLREVVLEDMVDSLSQEWDEEDEIVTPPPPPKPRRKPQRQRR